MACRPVGNNEQLLPILPLTRGNLDLGVILLALLLSTKLQLYSKTFKFTGPGLRKQLNNMFSLESQFFSQLCPGKHLDSQGLYPFQQKNFQDFSRTFSGLFQDSKIHINPFTPEISMLILLTVCHTFHIFYSSLTDFQTFPGPVAFFQDFPVLENVTIKFQDLPGFPGPIRTLDFLENKTNC